MTVYVKELKEAFYSGGEASPYRTRQNVVGYFLDEESCWKDAEAERDFYYTRGYNTDLFSNGKTIYMNTTVEGRGDYTKMTYSWNPIRLLEVNHRGLSAEEFGAEEFEAQEVDFWNQVAENKFSVIIYDTDSQKFYGGFVKEEEEFDAEEFDDMGFSLKMDRFSYQNEGKVIGIHDKELRQYRIYFGKEPMFYLNDAVFGYDNNNTVQGVVDDLNEALQDSIREVFQRLLWKSQRPDSLDVMLRGEEFGAESSVWAEIKEELGEGVSTSVYFIPKKPQTHSEMRSMIKEYFGITGSFPSQSHFHFITNDGYDIIPTTENDEGFDEPVFHIRKQDNERSWGAENKNWWDMVDSEHCDACEEVRDIEDFSQSVNILNKDPKELHTGMICDYCFEDFYDAEGISKPKEVVVKEECGLCGDTLILVDDGLGQKYKTCLGESCGYILPMNAEGMNLRKRIEDLIDLREVNFTGFKKDTKREAVKRARRIENEIKGVLPKGKSYKVDKPKWFKIAQTGIVLGVAGLVGYSGFKGKE